MSSSIINFLSYNSTGLDSVKINWIKDLIKTLDVDIFQLQEHFKSTKSVETCFKKQFDNCDSYVIPAYRETFQDSGRAKGGLAQLVLKHCDIKKERLKTYSWRIQSQILHINDYRLIWFNCFLPTDPQTVQYNNVELLSVLTEIEKILDVNCFDDCVLGGDFNFDKSRDTGFVKIISSLLDRIGLVSVWDKFPIDFTHLHTDLKSSSILDNFLCSQSFLDKVLDAGPLHLGDNRSRHSPIMMKVDLGDIPSRQNERESARPKKPA